MILKLFIKTENKKSGIINKLLYLVIICIVLSVGLILLNRVGLNPIVLLQKIVPVIRNFLPI